VLPQLLSAGIINAATWAGIDGDNINELIVIGEWMPAGIYKYRQVKFAKKQINVNIKFKNNGIQNDSVVQLEALTGWWNTIKAEDIDNDGDMDLIAGNRGTNSKIHGSVNEPATIYAKDFDGNGSYDTVLGYYIFGKCYPMYSRDALIDQMPVFRKKYTRYNMYSGKTMDELFTPEQKQGMEVFKANCFESGVFINNGNNNFTYRPLPEKAQLSNINDIVAEDFDKDGIKDMLVGGNSNDPDVSTGNYDATAAALLKGNTSGEFTVVDFTTAGLKLKGEILKMVYLKDKKEIIFFKNNAPCRLYMFK
jgi:hypothetical protein